AATRARTFASSGGAPKCASTIQGALFEPLGSGASSKAAAAVVAGSKVSTIMAAILHAAASSQERRMTCAAPFGGRPSSMAAATMAGRGRQWGACSRDGEAYYRGYAGKH